MKRSWMQKTYIPTAVVNRFSDASISSRSASTGRTSTTPPVPMSPRNAYVLSQHLMKTHEHGLTTKLGRD